MENITAKELLEFLKTKVETENYADSVHKIKLLTAIEMIEKTLGEGVY